MTDQTECICPLCGSAIEVAPDIVIDAASGTIVRNGKSIHLPQHLYRVFDVLWARQNRVTSEDVLWDQIYQLDPDGPPEDKSARVYISLLRKKLAALDITIKSTFGYGYQLIVG
ncbi:unnamed protein product, partial [Laminaria digitata]